MISLMQPEIGWIAENWSRVIVSITSTATAGFAAQAYRVWRRGKSDDLQIGTTRETALRDHYATELASLRNQIIKSGEASHNRQMAADDRYNQAMKASDEREAACLQRVDSLMARVDELQEIVAGFRDNLRQTERSAIILATHAPSIPIQEAAGRAAVALGQAEQRYHDDPID